MKSLAILGSTGSIGENTLSVVAGFPERFRVVALAAGGRRPERLAEQARETGARLVAVRDEPEALRLGPLLPEGVEVAWGTEGLVRAATAEGADMVVSAMVGAAGLVPTYAALVEGKDVAIANKETLVVAGELVMEAARRSGARLLPIDSEHSALFQVLQGRRPEEVSRLILTASGGPFRGFARERLARVSPKEALAHPNWSMGPKISVDSATLMNKGLEVIEAHWLFGVVADAIHVAVHPQSVIHSMVELVDGSILAQLGVADMRSPIAYALSFPGRLPLPKLRLDFTHLKGLTFEAPDVETFSCLSLAYEALRAGGAAPAVLSGANEVAVEAFLAGQLGFLQISEVVESALNAHGSRPLGSIQAALQADRWAREHARRWVADRGRGSGS